MCIVTHTTIPAFKRLKWEDCSEFKASLSYLARLTGMGTIQTDGDRKVGAREMAQEFRVLVALTEDQSSVPSTHSSRLPSVCKSSSRSSSSRTFMHVCTHLYAAHSTQHTCTN